MDDVGEQQQEEFRELAEMSDLCRQIIEKVTTKGYEDTTTETLPIETVQELIRSLAKTRSLMLSIERDLEKFEPSDPAAARRRADQPWPADPVQWLLWWRLALLSSDAIVGRLHGSLEGHDVALSFFNDINDKQLKRLSANVACDMPLADRLEKRASRFVNVGLTGINVGHLQNSCKDIPVARIWMVVHR
jgi:hypothetical protein